MAEHTPRDAEARVLAAVHLYEKVKLGLLVFVAVVVLAIGVQTLRNQTHQLETLTILNCAVSQEVQTARQRAGADPDARELAGRLVFNACVARGGPVEP